MDFAKAFEFCGRALDFSGYLVGDHHARAFLEEKPRGHFADTGIRAADDGRLALEFKVHLMPP